MAAKSILDKHSALTIARGKWNSLASSTARVGRYSDLIDLSAVRYPLILAHLRAKAAGTPTANKGVHLFWINHDGDGSTPLVDDQATWDANNMAAQSSLTQFGAQFLGSLWSGASPTSNMILGPATFRFPHPGVKGAFLIYQDLGVSLSLDDQEVVNGDFASDTVWSKGTGWAIAAGVATHTAGTASLLTQTGILTAGKKYRLTYTLSGISAGNIQQLSGIVNGPLRTANGTYVEDFECAGGVTDLFFFCSAAFNGSIDNVECTLIEPDAVNLIKWRGVNPELQ